MALPTIQAPTPAYTWPEQGQWSYDDWLRLPDDAYRYEIIEGELFVSPPPSIQHQVAVSSLLAAMYQHAKENELGLVLTAPIGVRLSGITAIVQPDLLFIRRERMQLVKDDGVDGAPDLVVEVLSPSIWIYDRTRKLDTYRQAGVREYWIVDYRARTVDILVLDKGEYVQRDQYGPGDLAPSEALPGFTIPVADLFTR